MANPSNTIVFLGNCQTIFVGKLLRRVSPFEVQVFGLDPDAYTAAIREIIDTASVIVAQVWPFEEEKVARFLAGLSRPVVRTPNVVLTYLWPGLANGRERSELGWTAATPRKILNASVLDQAMHESAVSSASGDEAVERYLSRDLASDLRVQRLKRANMAQIEAVCRTAGMGLEALADERVAEERPFHIYGHPTTRLTQALFDHAVRGFGELHPRAIENIDTVSASLVIESGAGMHKDKAQSPVHPTIAETFGLGWLDRADHVHPLFGLMDMRTYISALIRTEFIYVRLADMTTTAAELERELESHPSPSAVLPGILTWLRRAGRGADADAILRRSAPTVVEAPSRAVWRLGANLARQGQIADAIHLLNGLMNRSAEGDPLRERCEARIAKLGKIAKRRARRAALR